MFTGANHHMTTPLVFTATTFISNHRAMFTDAPTQAWYRIHVPRRSYQGFIAYSDEIPISPRRNVYRRGPQADHKAVFTDAPTLKTNRVMFTDTRSHHIYCLGKE